MKIVAHSLRVKIGLSQLELEKLELLIRLHDIGEITVSKKILLKNGTLEWDIIKKHPETGFGIARAIDGFVHVRSEERRVGKECR